MTEEQHKRLNNSVVNIVQATESSPIDIEEVIELLEKVAIKIKENPKVILKAKKYIK